jgi:hypothetical protein
MVKLATRMAAAKPESDDEERLLRLFWNRAELKKEFASLRREGDQLKEQLRKAEGVTLRAQHRLEQLEGMLADPMHAANASVFYQLRGVWASCIRKLTRLSSDLTANQTKREHHAANARHEESMRAALHVLDGQIKMARQREASVTEHLQAMHERHSQLRGFWNFFKRRALLAEIEQQEHQLQSAQTHTAQCRATKDEKLQEVAPEYAGLSLEGRRKMNLALIAIAQELFVHYSAKNISVLAREASVRQVTEVNYGNVDACRTMNAHIAKGVRSLPVGDDLVKKVRRRAGYLAEQATYRSETDAVPVAGSFANIQLNLDEPVGSHGSKSVSVNVLADEYWDIYSVLHN